MQLEKHLNASEFDSLQLLWTICRNAYLMSIRCLSQKTPESFLAKVLITLKI